MLYLVFCKRYFSGLVVFCTNHCWPGCVGIGAESDRCFFVFLDCCCILCRSLLLCILYSQIVVFCADHCWPGCEGWPAGSSCPLSAFASWCKWARTLSRTLTMAKNNINVKGQLLPLYFIYATLSQAGNISPGHIHSAFPSCSKCKLRAEGKSSHQSMMQRNWKKCEKA